MPSSKSWMNSYYLRNLTPAKSWQIIWFLQSTSSFEHHSDVFPCGFQEHQVLLGLWFKWGKQTQDISFIAKIMVCTLLSLIFMCIYSSDHDDIILNTNPEMILSLGQRWKTCRLKVWLQIAPQSVTLRHLTLTLHSLQMISWTTTFLILLFHISAVSQTQSCWGPTVKITSLALFEIHIFPSTLPTVYILLFLLTSLTFLPPKATHLWHLWPTLLRNPEHKHQSIWYVSNMLPKLAVFKSNSLLTYLHRAQTSQLPQWCFPQSPLF